MANGVAVVKAELLKALPRMQQLLPPGTSLTPQKIASTALMQVATDPELAKCDPASIVTAVCHAAALGLFVGPLLGEAYLVRYGSRCTLLPGYRGQVKLAMQSGMVRSIDVRLVYEGEHFDVQYGTNPQIIHFPALGGDRSDDKIVAGYLVAKLPNGETKFEVVTREEVDKVRAASKAKESGPWKDWYAEMFKKTVARRGLKLLPASIDDQRLQAAIELDNRFDTGRITAPTTLLDTEDEVAADVRDKTQEKANALRERVTPKATAKLDPAMEIEMKRQEQLDGEQGGLGV